MLNKKFYNKNGTFANNLFSLTCLFRGPWVMTHRSDWLMVHFPAPLLSTCDIRRSGAAATARRILMWWVWERMRTGNGRFHYVWGNAGPTVLLAVCSVWVSDRGRGQGSSFLRAAAGSPVGHYLWQQKEPFHYEVPFFLLITADIPLSESSPGFHKSSISCHFTDFLKSRCLHQNPGCDYRKQQVWIKPVQQEDFLWINAFWWWANITLLCPSLCKLGIVF